MYLIKLDFNDNSIEVIRDIPDSFEEDDVDNFVINTLHRDRDNDVYMLCDEDSALTYSTYYPKNNMIKEDYTDYFGQHF